ncbi:hypothetical protein L2E82_28277 [Cichorium intybus]|uniref:Uncharacterized protein n=1 Tax=Cichorium intybus TaxID=13427 RepID=A0ACB9CVA2_CICIN|nr:hypothetical protein L2E82_28277 [Cichorium intybus]
MSPPFIRLASCCSSLVRCSLNLRWKSVRWLAYTTCSDESDWFPDTSVLRHPVEKVGKFKVIETLDQSKRERSSALSFGRQLKESGFKDDVETYMGIVRLLCHSGMDVRLNILFMHVIGREVVGFEMSDLLEALIEEKLIKAVDVLVMVYASVGRQLKRNGLIRNVDTYEILVKGDCEEGCLEQVLDVFEEMKEAGVEPNAFIHSRYIRGLCSIGKTHQAFHLIKILRELNKPIDVFAYSCVIQGFVQESKLQDAEDVLLGEMKVREVVPDADCYGALIVGYYEEGESAKALDLCDEMESRGISSDYVCVRCMIRFLCGVGRLDKALDWFKYRMQSSRVFIDEVTFDLAIDAACQLGKMEDAMELVEGMKCRKTKPWEMHYRTLIDGYCLRGEPWNALYVFQEMMRNGLRPDSTPYHVLARGFQGCGLSLPLSMLFNHL